MFRRYERLLDAYSGKISPHEVWEDNGGHALAVSTPQIVRWLSTYFDFKPAITCPDLRCTVGYRRGGTGYVEIASDMVARVTQIRIVLKVGLPWGTDTKAREWGLFAAVFGSLTQNRPGISDAAISDAADEMAKCGYADQDYDAGNLNVTVRSLGPDWIALEAMSD
jgi:hypothetical protein